MEPLDGCCWTRLTGRAFCGSSSGVCDLLNEEENPLSEKAGKSENRRGLFSPPISPYLRLDPPVIERRESTEALESSPGNGSFMLVGG